MNELTVERMIEIEKMVENYNIIFPLTNPEWYYYELADKIPYKDIEELILLYKKYFIPINFLIDGMNMLEKYNCSRKELFLRIENVNKIMKYYNKLNTNLLKEQKKMLKRMKKV